MSYMQIWCISKFRFILEALVLLKKKKPEMYTANLGLMLIIAQLKLWSGLCIWMFL